MARHDVSGTRANATWLRTLLALSGIISLGIGSTAAADAKDHPNSITDELRILDANAQHRDSLPGSIQDQQIDQESARLLAATPAANHWVLIRNNSDICLVSVLALSETMGMTCASGEIFERRGLSQSLEHRNGEQIEAHLVPDGHIKGIAETTGWTQLSSNLLISDPSAESIGTITSDDGSFTLIDPGPTRDALNKSGPTSVGVKNFASRAVVKYADNTPVQRLVKLQSHPARSGAVMTGAHTEIVDYPYATVYSELVGTEPPHHRIAVNKSRGFVRVKAKKPIRSISMCWWSTPEPFDIEPGLHCWYST